MQQSEIDEWADTLESGDYLQGRGRLCRIGDGPNGQDTWCCLGVKANLDVKAGRYGLLDLTRQYDGGGSQARTFGTSMDTASRTGLVHANQLGLSGYQVETLVNMNDGRTATFADIAAWIRANIRATD